jgi:hypothetical protein
MVMTQTRAALAAGALALCGAPIEARAEPYRLRADVFAEAPDPSGFVLLQAAAHERSVVLVDAEAMLWTGAGIGPDGDVEAQGEAVIAAVRVRDVERGLGLRFGRLLYAGGAVRPIHLDGAVASVSTPIGAQAELFAGIPVVPRFEGRSFDWLVGGRVTQDIGGVANAGVSYWQERDAGQLARSELGIEASATPHRLFALTSTAAVDVERLGLVSARLSALLHDGANRLELFGVRRSPSLMLPATSLFAALGSYDADEIGTTGFYRVAPRLDLSATATVDLASQSPGATQSLRAELRLDDEGRGALGFEARRVSMPDASWTGARAWLRLPLIESLSASAEAEVAVPDVPGDRGAAWPWLLAGLRYVPLQFLEAAAAVEVSSTPAYSASVGGLLRLSGTWSSR